MLKNAAAYADNAEIAKLTEEVTNQWAAYQQNPTGYFDTEELMQLDKECCEALQTTQTKAFVIYHPALTYYARAYGLEQIAIESEGKEPSAKHIANIIEQAKAKGAKSLLYQKEFPRSVVEVIADDMGLEPTEINPLQENAMEFIKDITKTITTN